MADMSDAQMEWIVNRWAGTPIEDEMDQCAKAIKLLRLAGCPWPAGALEGIMKMYDEDEESVHN